MADMCRETVVLRSAHRIGEERPTERIYICDRVADHRGQHIADHPYDGTQLIWSDVAKDAPR
jgi:molybdopterin synthase catalytic subunit